MLTSSKIVVSSFFALMLVASVFAISTDPVFSSSDDLEDAIQITDDISASDIVESEEEIESERSSYVKRTVSSGSGWIITGQKGALLDIHLVSGYTDNKTATSKGWIKAGKLKLKIESTQSIDTKKTFDVSAGDGSVSGTLVLNRDSTYQTGFAVWSGKLDLKVRNSSYEAKVNLAIEERAIGEGKIKEQKERSEASYNGVLELAGVEYELQGKFDSNLKKLELKIAENDGTKGEIVLEKVSGNDYVGKLKIESENDAGDEDKLVGRLKATLTSEGNTLYGPVSFVGEDGSQLSGNIKIAFTRTVDSSRDSSDDSSDDSKSRNRSGNDEKKEDRSGSNSGSDSENRGFWKRFIDFFGA